MLALNETADNAEGLLGLVYDGKEYIEQKNGEAQL